MKTIKVVCAVIKKGNQILIAQRLKGEFKGLWEFPGGKIEAGETPEQALIREINEEMEVEVNVEQYLMTAEYSYSSFHLSMDCFLCKLENENIILNDHTAVQWISIATSLQNVQWIPADIQVFNFLQQNLK